MIGGEAQGCIDDVTQTLSSQQGTPLKGNNRKRTLCIKRDQFAKDLCPKHHQTFLHIVNTPYP